MCTLVILRRPGDDWPVLIGANRDEMIGRPWRAPARHWPDRADVVAGLDEEAGGSWLGVNDDGVAAAVLNRVGSLGPAPDKRSRGELVLEALDHADAGAAANALADLNGDAYRPFNLVVADSVDGFWLRHDGAGPPRFEALRPGLSMLTAHGLNDRRAARIAANLPRFERARAPDPAADDWQEWEELLASQESAGEQGDGAMCVAPRNGFGTVNTSLIALAAPHMAGRRWIWRFASVTPIRDSFTKIMC